MRTIVVGLGIQGKKRINFAGSDVVATVDVALESDYDAVTDVPLDQYDCALLCTPDHAKIELITYLLGHGKHVLTEKPLIAGTDRELEELIAIRDKSKATYYTAYNHRFEPHFKSVAELIQSGQLGKIFSISMFYGNGTARDVRNSPWRDKGFGIIPDLGSHLLDTLLFWTGNLDYDFVPYQVDRFENKSPDHILFGCESPISISLECSMVSWRNSFRCFVVGDQGSAHVDCLCKWGPSTLTVYDRKLPSGRPDSESKTLVCPDPTWAEEYRHFVDLVNRKDPGNLENDLLINRTLNHLYDKIN